MDLKEFERQVLTGEITDFRPYFTKPYDKTDRKILYPSQKKNGLFLDSFF